MVSLLATILTGGWGLVQVVPWLASRSHGGKVCAGIEAAPSYGQAMLGRQEPTARSRRGVGWHSRIDLRVGIADMVKRGGKPRNVGGDSHAQ